MMGRYTQWPRVVIARTVGRAWIPARSRGYKVLAIESSCDDLCVALMEKSAGEPAVVIDHVRTTLDSAAAGGIIPTDAQQFHLASLGPVLAQMLAQHGGFTPDLVCCTRGPGMMGSLSAGMQIAKGLALAWQVPLVGVHHMLGHVLVAGLLLPPQAGPRFPYLSLLCSGGHTMLVLSRSVADHCVLANTGDIAAGDSLDKCARELGFQGVMLGRELEHFVAAIPPTEVAQIRQVKTHDAEANEYGFRLALPLRRRKHREAAVEVTSEPVEFAFAGFLSSLQSYRHQKLHDAAFDARTRQFLAVKVQDLIFDHIVDRVNVALERHAASLEGVRDFVVSGGVAANLLLRHKLAAGVRPFEFHFPPLALCTDNAIMIGVAGTAIFEQLRVRSDLNVLPIRKWPMDALLAADGWVAVGDKEYKGVIGEE